LSPQSRQSWKLGDSATEHIFGSIDSKSVECEFPAQVVVRNTFIEAPLGRALSLDCFFEERQTHSCPVSPKRRIDMEFDVQPAQLDSRQRASTADRPTAAPALCKVAAPAKSRTESSWKPSLQASLLASKLALTKAQKRESTPKSMPRILVLSTVLPEKDSIPDELLTVGSTDHGSGTCKPCGFFHGADGCTNGASCPFCHLCPPGEKRRRQKEKRAAFYEKRRKRKEDKT